MHNQDGRRIAIGRDRTAFKVLQGESFTVPDTKTNPAVLTPLAVATVSRTSGGEIVCEFSDAAGPAQRDIGYTLEPGDVVACSAVVANEVTVTVTSRNADLVATWKIAPVADIAGVIGFWN